MTGIMTPAVRLHHFRFGTFKPLISVARVYVRGMPTGEACGKHECGFTFNQCSAPMDRLLTDFVGPLNWSRTGNKILLVSKFVAMYHECQIPRV
jgi:hypothetical protein